MTLRVVGRVAVPGGAGKGFDHADTFLASAGSRLYVAHTAMDVVDVIDCRSDRYLRSIRDLPGVAGVLIDTESDRMFTSDRAVARASIFRCSDETLLGRVAVGPRPNGLAYDRARRRLFTFNLGEPPGTDCTASVIDVDGRAVLRTIALPGRPRWAVYDPKTDTIYANIQSPAVILRIDAATLATRGTIAVPAAGPHGLAVIEGLLFCAADGGELVVIDDAAGDGRVVARLPLRGAPDVVWDARPRLYVAIGSPGVVTVIDTDRLAEVETVATDEGAHTLGWDPETRKLYVFAPAPGAALVMTEAA